METALQEAIEKFEDLKENSQNLKDKLYLDAVIAILTNQLPKEREQILTAYAFGSLNKTENLLNGVAKITAQEYYETNFNK